MASLAVAGFPVDLLDGCETALVVFAAAFGGVQDAAYIRDAGLRATCVDIDARKLLLMRDEYPDEWLFVNTDAFELSRLAAGKRWDVVTLDPWHGDLMERTHKRLADFATFARKLLIVGSEPDLEALDGWRVVRRDRRSAHEGGTYWTVMEPC